MNSHSSQNVCYFLGILNANKVNGGKQLIIVCHVQAHDFMLASIIHPVKADHENMWRALTSAWKDCLQLLQRGFGAFVCGFMRYITETLPNTHTVWTINYLTFLSAAKSWVFGANKSTCIGNTEKGKTDVDSNRHPRRYNPNCVWNRTSFWPQTQLCPGGKVGRN